MIAIDMAINEITGCVSFGESMEVTADTDSPTLFPAAGSLTESAVGVSAFQGQSSRFVTAAEISPYPKIHERTERRVSKSCGAAVILTSSPYKVSWEEYHAKKQKLPKTNADKRHPNPNICTGEVGGKKCRKSTNKKKNKPKDAPISEVLLEKRPKIKKREKQKVSNAIADGENIEDDTTEDVTQCGVCCCGITFDIVKKAENGRNWLQCQLCGIWYHNVCQGLLNTDTLNEFVCIGLSCDD